jgi:hypothetical protein
MRGTFKDQMIEFSDYQLDFEPTGSPDRNPPFTCTLVQYVVTNHN